MINFNPCILLSNVFIRTGELEKKNLVEFALKHWRQHNREAHIVVTGHGLKPDIEKYCNYVLWPEQIIEKEINKGHPYLVSQGLEYIEQKGFEYVVKSRCDTVHTMKNIFEFALDKLAKQKMLVTQQTSLQKQELGDLFLFGKVTFMKRIFNIDNWYPTRSGLNSLANNFFAQCDEDVWSEACLKNLQLIDICKLRWIDFRSNWDQLKNKKDELLSFNLDAEHKYYWGVKEGWHLWDSEDNCTYKLPHITIEKEWYR